MEEHGPKLPVSIEIDKQKYRQQGETFREKVSRVSNTLADDVPHFYKLREIMLEMKFLPAGRVQAAIGSPRKTTAYNCFVSGTIQDSMRSIMDRAAEAAYTMRLGGGIGYDFSNIRPYGDNIVSLESKASGPVSFMQIYDAVCKTVSSTGHRRGAQMAVVRVDHPDIETFIEAKTNGHNLTQFNVSVGITDDFMRAVLAEEDFELKFEGRVYKRVDANYLFDKIMRATWDWAEPGVLFIDRINEMNNLHYCEEIYATNPCGEQPLPPHGACLLGSFNLVKYLTEGKFDWETLKADIPHVVRAMDNIIDLTVYPLEEQKVEAESKRRMGLGVTALANCGEYLGYPYGSPEFIRFTTRVLRTIANECYRASAELAKEKGPFPLFTGDYLEGQFIQRLDQDVRDAISANGIRNSHLLSIAPTGTISLAADNISSGIEPVYRHSFSRLMKTDDGDINVTIDDYGVRELGVEGKQAWECTTDEHLAVLIAATKWTDSAVSKTINVGSHVEWAEFKEIYLKAWKKGCKGCTTFRADGKRSGVLTEQPKDEDGGGACYINPETGQKECG